MWLIDGKIIGGGEKFWNFYLTFWASVSCFRNVFFIIPKLSLGKIHLKNGRNAFIEVISLEQHLLLLIYSCGVVIAIY